MTIEVRYNADGLLIVTEEDRARIKAAAAARSLSDEDYLEQVASEILSAQEERPEPQLNGRDLASYAIDQSISLGTFRPPRCEQSPAQEERC